MTVQKSVEFLPSGVPIQVNTFETGPQDQPSIATLANGDLIVVWSSFGEDGVSREIFGQRLTPEGEKIGEQFQVNETTLDVTESRPEVYATADGGFQVFWASENSWRLVESRIFDAEGTGAVKWSQKTGQLAKVYPKPLKGYEHGEAPEFYRSV